MLKFLKKFWIYLFCQHREITSIKYYVQEFFTIRVYRLSSCKKCGHVFEQKISEYDATWNTPQIREFLERKGIKSIEDI